MLGSITPLGERGRRSTWGVTMTAFLTGSAAGGAAVGGLLGLVGAALPPLCGSGAPRLWVLAGLIALGLAMDVRAAGMALPTVHRQVNEDWLHRSEEHTSELQSHHDLVCRLLLEKKK